MLVRLSPVFPLLVFPLLVFSGADSQVAKETALMTKALPDMPGKEGLIEKVILAPDELVPPHRHNADVFVYVPEGVIITRVKGGKSQTLHAGDVYYESPTDIHNGSRNASTAQPATLLVFFVKKIGAPTTVALPAGDATH